ncbi:MAG: hypothetical protein AABW87_02190, partial [Nanoarchaeota archaeon]
SLKGEEADPKAGKDPVEELPEFDRLIIAELVLEVATLASVRMKGVSIKAFYTEDVGDDDLDKIVREGAATDCGLEYISRMLKASGLRFEKKKGVGLLHMVGDARDQIIFDNVNRQGGDKNVLRMGSNHKLKIFDYGDHDFDVYRLDLADRGETKTIVRGEIPRGLFDTIEDLKKTPEFNGVEFDVWFKDE